MPDNKSDTPDSTAAVGYSRLFSSRQPSELDIQRGIDAAMRDVIRTRYNPSEISANRGVVPTKGSGNGWVTPPPLTPPPGQDHIQRIADQLLPHGPNYKKQVKGD